MFLGCSGVPRVLVRRSHLLPEQLYGAADDQPRPPPESVASPTAGCNPMECVHDDETASQRDIVLHPVASQVPWDLAHSRLSRDLRLAIAARSLVSTSRIGGARNLRAITAITEKHGQTSTGTKTAKKPNRHATPPVLKQPVCVSATGDLIKGRYCPRPTSAYKDRAADSRLVQRGNVEESEDDEYVTDADQEGDEDDDMLVRKVLQESGLDDSESSSCDNLFVFTLTGALVTALLLLVYVAVLSNAPLPAASTAAAAATRLLPLEMNALSAAVAGPHAEATTTAPLFPLLQQPVSSFELTTSHDARFGAESVVVA